MQATPDSTTPETPGAAEGGTAAPARRRGRRVRRVASSVGLLGFASLGWAYADPFYVPPVVPDVVVQEAQMPGSLRVLTLNVAHGRGTSFHQLLTRPTNIRRNLDAVAKLIRASGADVVALQELDAPSAWSGGFDHLAYLAAETGYEHSYHGLHVDRRTPRLAYGTGILSRYPIRQAHSQAFGLNALDTKGYVLAQVETPAGAVDVVSVHLDFKRDAERKLQLAMLSAYLERRPDPSPFLVVAGDFNCASTDSDGVLTAFTSRHTLLIADANGGATGTFPSHRPRRRIDYVLASNGLSFVRRVVIPVEVSDHLPVLAEVAGF